MKDKLRELVKHRSEEYHGESKFQKEYRDNVHELVTSQIEHSLCYSQCGVAPTTTVEPLFFCFVLFFLYY